MWLWKQYVYIMKKKDRAVFIALLTVMFLAPSILNFSHAAFRNYQNVKLSEYLDLNNFSVCLNENITKGQLEDCLIEFSEEINCAISDIILDVKLGKEILSCRFTFQDGVYGRSDGYLNLIENNFVTTYFTEEQEKDGELVALAPIDDIYSWGRAEGQIDTVVLQGKQYRIIGYQSWDSSYMIPYASLDEATEIEKSEGITIYWKEAVTERQYREVKDTLNRVLGNAVTVPDVVFTDAQKDGLQHVMVIIIFLLAAVFSCNIWILMYYIRERMQRERKIYYICGMTKGRMFLLELGSVLVLSIPTYAAGNLLYYVVVGRIIHKWLGHLTTSMLASSYLDIFIIYICSLMLIVAIRTGMTMRTEGKWGRE